MACPTCQIITCENVADIDVYSLQSGVVFTNGALSFVPTCPAGYSCSGLPPIITIPPGVFTFPVPPVTPSVLTMICCESSVSRVPPANATPAQIAALVAAMFEECARQQVNCTLISNPPPGTVVTPVSPPSPPPHNVRVNICNDAQVASVMCGGGGFGVITRTVPACQFGESLWNATAALIAERKAYWNSIALAYVQDQIAAITPPSISNGSTLAMGQVGAAYSVQLNGVGASPFTFLVSFGSLPDGLSLSSSGLISGTPAEEQTTNFTVVITDTNGDACSKEFSIEVIPAGECEVTSEGGFCLERDQPYSNQYSAAGGTAPYTFTVSAGALPDGLTLSSAGLLSGTPTVDGTYNFTIKATDATMAFCTLDQTMEVNLLCGTIPVNAEDMVWTDTLAAYGGFTLNFSDGANATFSCAAIVSCPCPTSGQEIQAQICNPCDAYDLEITIQFSANTTAPFSCLPAPPSKGRLAFSVFKNGSDTIINKFYSTAAPATDIVPTGDFSDTVVGTVTVPGHAAMSLQMFFSLCQGTSVSGTISFTPVRHP